MAKGTKTNQYKVKYNMLDWPGTQEIYGTISASSVTQAADQAEKMLVADGVPAESFEIISVNLLFKEQGNAKKNTSTTSTFRF